MHANKASKVTLKSCINEFDLIDIFRKLNLTRKTYTRAQSQPYTATRLNFFLIGRNLRHHIKKANVDASLRSDYKIDIITLNLEFEEWGRGYWKLNSDMLLHDDSIKTIEKVINDFLLTNTDGHASPHILWESLKCVIRGETIKYCSLKKKKFNQPRESLEKIGFNGIAFN